MEFTAPSRLEVIKYTAPPGVNGRDSVIVFLRRIAEQTCNVMPDSTEVYLQFYDKKQIYEIYCKQFSLIHNELPPVLAYCYVTWKEHAGHIKIRKVKKFTKWATCESSYDEVFGMVAACLPASDFIVTELTI